MLILECSQGCYGRTDGRTEGSVSISFCNFVGERITSLRALLKQCMFQTIHSYQRGCHGRDCMVVGFITTYAISLLYDYEVFFPSLGGTNFIMIMK
jgi:hypothetical protein